MISWKEKRRTCKSCHGTGYHRSANKNHQGRPAWTTQCVQCQPLTFDEVQQAVDEEQRDMVSAMVLKRGRV